MSKINKKKKIIKQIRPENMATLPIIEQQFWNTVPDAIVKYTLYL